MLFRSRDPGWKMVVPLVVFSAFIVVFGLYSSPFVEFFQKVANGIY